VALKRFALLLLIVSNSSWGAPQKCTSLYQQLAALPGDNFIQLRIEKSGIELSKFRKCLGKKYARFKVKSNAESNSSAETILKKGQILKIPVLAEKSPPRPWQAFNRIGIGNFSSAGSRKTRYFYNDIRAAYTWPIEDKFSLIGSLGLKFMQADLTESNGKNENDFGLTGSLVMYFMLQKDYTPYAFFKLDRYVVTGADELGSNYSFLFSRAVGAGIKWDVADSYILHADAAMVGATKSQVNNILSGYLVGLELDHRWPEISAGYRLERFEIKTNEYRDQGWQHVIKIGYQF
jgi:hypothetical protein